MTQGRLDTAITLHKMMVYLSQQAYTARELSKKFEIHQRTVHRYLRAIHELGVYIVVEDDFRYRVEKKWLRRFLE